MESGNFVNSYEHRSAASFRKNAAPVSEIPNMAILILVSRFSVDFQFGLNNPKTEKPKVLVSVGATKPENLGAPTKLGEMANNPKGKGWMGEKLKAYLAIFA